MILNSGWVRTQYPQSFTQQEGTKVSFLTTVSAEDISDFIVLMFPASFLGRCSAMSHLFHHYDPFLLSRTLTCTHHKSSLGEDVAWFWSHINNISSILIWPLHSNTRQTEVVYGTSKNLCRLQKLRFKSCLWRYKMLEDTHTLKIVTLVLYFMV